MARLTFPSGEDRLVYTVEAGSDIRPAVNRKIRIYSDAAGTTLADIQTPAGATIANSELTVDGNSLLPLFLGPDTGTTVVYAKAVGGSAVVPLYTDVHKRVDGVVTGTGFLPRAEAEGTLARKDTVPAAYQILANTNILLGSQLQSLSAESGYSYGIVDVDGRLALGISLDGHVIGQFRLQDGAVEFNHLGSSLNYLKWTTIDSAVSGFSQVWVDESNRQSFWVKTSGEFGFTKLDAETSAYIQTLAGTSAVPTDYTATGVATVHPISSGPNIAMWGDSLTASGTVASKLASLTGRTVYNAGVGGENAFGIAARQGAMPLMLTPVGGSIPASGSVDIATYGFSYPNATAPKILLQGTGVRGTASTDFIGTWAGVKGKFTLRVKDAAVPYPTASANDIYAFERTTAGTAVAVNKPMPLIPEHGVNRAGDLQIIWQGQNGPTQADNTAMFKAEINSLKTAHPRYLLATGTGYTNTGWTTEELAMVAEWGRRYINIRRYLIDYALADLSMTPTAQDNTDVANGTVPTSLRTDSVHHTVAAQNAIAEFLILPRLRELGWVA